MHLRPVRWALGMWQEQDRGVKSKHRKRTSDPIRAMTSKTGSCDNDDEEEKH